MNLKEINKQIKEFKEETKKFTKWDTGYHILDFVDTRRAFEYGKLIGKRDILNEIHTPTDVGEKTSGGV